MTEEREIKNWIEERRKGSDLMCKLFNRNKELEEENEELKEKVSYLEDNLRVARKYRENLQLKVGKGLKDFIKDCPYSALKLYANGYYVEQLTKAKEIIQKLCDIVCGKRMTKEKLRKEAEQFLNSEVE